MLSCTDDRARRVGFEYYYHYYYYFLRGGVPRPDRREEALSSFVGSSRNVSRPCETLPSRNRHETVTVDRVRYRDSIRGVSRARDEPRFDFLYHIEREMLRECKGDAVWVGGENIRAELARKRSESVRGIKGSKEE